MLKYVSALALATASLGIASPAAAQYAGGGLHAGELEVPVNKSQVVSTDQTIGKALIGNPDIADIVPISDRSVYVLGKDFGTTSLTLYDRSNRVIAVMDVSVGPDVMSLRNQLRDMIPGSQIDASLSNGNIVLSGLVGNAGEADRAMRIAEAFAGERVINLMGVGSSQQVMLEVKFAEVTRNLGEELGVSGFASSPDFVSAIGEGAGNEDTLFNLQLDQVTGAFGVFGALFNIGNVDIDALLDVLERQGLSKTLAEPTLVSLSGEKASFLAGGEFPIPVIQGSGGGEGGSSAITVEFKPFGVSLGFTPTVLGDGVINMIVEPEVSSIDPSASVSINGLNVPGLQTRRASTTIELRDGESFAIAGLLREEFTTTVRQVPILGSIPIIGTLFRSTSFQKGETELLIIVTPRLVNPIRPEQVRLPTDRVRDPQVVDTLLNGDNYQPQELPPAGAATTTATDTETGYEY